MGQDLCPRSEQQHVDEVCRPKDGAGGQLPGSLVIF